MSTFHCKFAAFKLAFYATSRWATVDDLIDHLLKLKLSAPFFLITPPSKHFPSLFSRIRAHLIKMAAKAFLSFVESIASKMGSLTFPYIQIMFCLNGDKEKIWTLSAIKAVLSDAEGQQQRTILVKFGLKCLEMFSMMLKTW